jgi:DNA invertase Pin-like site-specific DNA recombinase
MARKSRKNADTAVVTAPAARTWNVGAYVRLSAVDRKQKGDSIENQQAIIAAYCDAHRTADGMPELIIREIYIDNGLSGQSFERPAFQRMLADMENGVIDSCAAKDLSRYGRSAIDTGYYIEKYFPAIGIRCIAINDNYDSADSHNSDGITVNLKNLVNESYALDIGRKIHDTKQMNIRNGCFVGAIPPYGYLKSAEDNHKLVPDPQAAPIVSKMFEMAASGVSTSDIHKWLMANGTLPPMKHFLSIGVVTEKKAKGGGHWSISVVYTILKNQVYTGDMVQGKGRTQSYKASRIEKENWIITPDTHESLVSRDVFDDVQKRFTGEKAPRNPALGENIFRGKIFCGHCGHAMSRTKSGKSSYLFKCETRFRYDRNDCVLVSINEDKLKSILLEILHTKSAVYCAQSVMPQTVISQEPNELANVCAELKRANGFLKALYESLVDGDITESEYREMKQSYEIKIAGLTEHEKQLRETARERHLKQSATNKASKHLSAANNISDITADLLDALVERILVFPDKHIEVKFKFTDEISERRADK